jgi:hypothetical protein
MTDLYALLEELKVITLPQVEPVFHATGQYFFAISDLSRANGHGTCSQGEASREARTESGR